MAAVRADATTSALLGIRYLDTFAKRDGAWLFAEHRLMVDWTDTRPSTPPGTVGPVGNGVRTGHA
jgi:hypothetical protein